MKNKPLFLKLFPLFALAIALSFPLQIMYLYKIPYTDIIKVFSMLTPLNLISMSVLFTTAILTASMSRSVYKMVPILLVALFANNAIVGLYGSDYTVVQVALSFFLFAFSLKPFYAQEVKAVILNPNLRWWKTPERFNVKKDLKISNGSFDIFSETTNISSTGLFAKVEDEKLLRAFELNEVIDIQLGETDKLFKAKVVRVNDKKTERSDVGFGLQICKDSSHKEVYLPWFKENTASA